MKTLFTPYNLGGVELKNRVVMAPMTRTRTLNDIADDVVALYYAQRASAGLLITEGLPVSEEGRGYLYTPGLYNDAHVEGWRKVTDAVHAKGGRIFAACGMWGVCLIPHYNLVILPPSLQAPFLRLIQQYLPGTKVVNPARLPQAFRVHSKRMK